MQKELNDMKEMFNLGMEEKRQREERNAFMQRKKDEMDAKLNKVIKASEYI